MTEDGRKISLEDRVDFAEAMQELLAGLNRHGTDFVGDPLEQLTNCLLYTSPSPRDRQKSRMPSSA